MKKYFDKIREIILDCLFPQICASCLMDLDKSEKQNNICKKCASRIEIFDSFLCGVCRSRLPDNKKTCHKDAKYILGSASNFDNQIVQKIIKNLKYEKRSENSKALAYLLQSFIIRSNFNFQDFILIPIPIHKNKEKLRGFNQTELIADELSKLIGVKVLKNILFKVRDTDSQTKMEDYKSREINIENSFSIKSNDLIKDKNIIILDDVTTSGATLKETSRVLKKSGVKKIIALVVAKT